MIEIESVKIKIGKKVVEVTKDDVDLVTVLAELLEVVREKPPVYIPCPWTPYWPSWTPYYPSYPNWSETTDDCTRFHEDRGTVLFPEFSSGGGVIGYYA